MNVKDLKIERFDNISQFLDVLKNRGVNEVFKSELQNSQKISDNLWSGTRTYEEADNLIMRGYEDGLMEMEGYRKKIKNGESARGMVTCGVVGYAPIVPNAIAGIPLSMACTRKEPIKRKTARVFVDLSTCCRTKKERILKCGREVLDEIIREEANGVQIELVLGSFFVKKGHAVGMVVKAKEYGQRINPLKCAYMLVHPSMLRRHSFRWLETYPGLKEKAFSIGYGYSLFYAMGENVQDARSLLIKESVIKDGDVYINMNYYHDRGEREEIKIDTIDKTSKKWRI